MERMTLGQQLALRTNNEVLVGQAKHPSTRRILRRCLPSLSTVIDEVAAPEAGGLALPACYGRHVIFASPHRGMVADMLHWADPIQELLSDEADDRAAMWSAIASFVHKTQLPQALAGVATRLGPEGIAQFEETFSRLDKSMGEVVFQGSDIRLVTRGVLIVLAGVYEGASAGIIGALPLPIVVKPGPVADWHEVNWSADGNHRRLH